MRSDLVVKRIEVTRKAAAYILDVTSDQGQPMSLRRRGKQGVHYGNGSLCGQTAPNFSDLLIDRKNSRTERFNYFIQPLFQRVRVPRIAFAQLLNALTNLSDNQDAEIEVLIGDLFKPGSDARIASFSLAQLGNDVGIDQVHQDLRTVQNLMMRPVSCERVISTPSSGAEAKRALRLFPRVLRRRYSSAGTTTATGLP
jgi:hypothetical protein